MFLILEVGPFFQCK